MKKCERFCIALASGFMVLGFLSHPVQASKTDKDGCYVVETLEEYEKVQKIGVNF